MAVVALHAQDALYVSQTSGTTLAFDLTTVNSVSFASDGSTVTVNQSGTNYTYNASSVSEMSYGEMPSGIKVVYSGTSASVIIPSDCTDDITASVSGADVTITNTNTSEEYTTTLTGTTTNGSFTYVASCKSTIVLDGVSITSTKGAAIDIECGKRVALEIKKGTVNTLVDCANGSQKACLYCKGHLEIDKDGTLNVTGNTKHAISSKEYIQLKKADGTINILGAVSDGIHCSQYFLGSGFVVNVSNVGGDGIQAEASGDSDYDEDYADGSLTVQGGVYKIGITADDAAAIKADADITISNAKTDPTFTITTSGAADKGLKTDGNVNISAGTMTITQTGSYLVEDGELSYTTGIKADGNVNITGGSITINNTADGGKGISADGNVNISGSATVVDVTANGKGGTVDLSSDTSSTQTTASYKVYVKLPSSAQTMGGGFGPGSSTGSQVWSTVYLYKSDGTLVKQLTDQVTVTGSTGISATFYYYDFGASDSGTYYFKSADYSSRGMGWNSSSTTYTIKSANISGPTSGTDYFYEISNSYSTSGTVRTYSVSSVNSTYAGGTTDLEDAGEAYSATCIKADSQVNISEGTVTLKNSGMMSKSIKAGNSSTEGTVTISGGTVTSTTTGTLYVSGNDASYCTAIKCDNYVGNGGTVGITATTGQASHGISADKTVTIESGTYTITNSCAGYTGTNDTYTAKAITCDGNIVINGGTFNISMSGTGGKGIKTDGTLTVGTTGATGPSITVKTTGSTLSSSSSSTSSWNMGGGMGEVSGSDAKAIKAYGTATINSGSLNVSTSTDGAEGLESKTSIVINGGTHYFACYDDCINSSGCIYFNGGTTVCYSNGNDAVDSNAGKTGAITIAGGNVFAYSTKGAPEEGLDCDNCSYMVVKGGIAISAGGAQGGGSSSSLGSSTQGYYLGSSPSSYNSSYYYTLCNTSGTPICTYKFNAACSNSLGLLTATDLGKGSVTVKYGTAKPTACSESVNGVFFINPTVTTTGTSATVTAK